MFPSEDNGRKASVFVLLMLCAFVYAYVAAVPTSVMLMLMQKIGTRIEWECLSKFVSSGIIFLSQGFFSVDIYSPPCREVH